MQQTQRKSTQHLFYRGAENDGHENDGPSKCPGMKLTDMKIKDKCRQIFRTWSSLTWNWWPKNWRTRIRKTCFKWLN